MTDQLMEALRGKGKDPSLKPFQRKITMRVTDNSKKSAVFEWNHIVTDDKDDAVAKAKIAIEQILANLFQ